MNTETIIVQAQKLIERAKGDFINKTNPDKYRWFDHEYYVLYNDAIELLLENGFVKDPDIKIQRAYFDLIPEPEVFSENHEYLNKLYSDDVALRISAAKYFSNLAREEASVFRGVFFRYPKTFELLIPVLQDANLKVVRDIIITLGCAYNRYFKDPRVETALYEFYNHKDKEILTFAILWTAGIEKGGKFDRIFPLLESKPSAKVLEALCMHFKTDSKIEIKQKAVPILIDCLFRKLSNPTKSSVVRALLKILDDKTIEIFKTKLDLNKDGNLKALFIQQMDRYCTKDQIAFLREEIL